MVFEHDALTLAAERRRNLFARLPDDVGAVVTSQQFNKGYLSGYFSMSNDTSIAYRSAAVVTRDTLLLVVSAADAGPALEFLGDPDNILRFGTFYFETAGNTQGLDFDGPGFPSFELALTQAIRKLLPKGTVLGVDDSDTLGLGPALVELEDTKTRPVGEEITKLRWIKLPGEVERIRHATQLVEDGITAVRSNLAEGMTENEIAGLVARAMTAGGGFPRFISVTSGPRSALADAYATGRQVGKGELIRIDAGCVVDGFCSDMARTFVVGEPESLARRRYDAIAAGLEAELATVKAGVSGAELFDIAVSTVRANGLTSYRRHHCGHGLGLGGYEQPIIGNNVELELQQDMCICVETPYYQIGWGGMMVEDTVLVTDTGHEPITTISRDLICV